MLQGSRDVICISGTGSGKTLTFWMPLLFRPQGVQVIITPLNILGTQTQQQLQSYGISAIAIRGETATYANIEVLRLLSEDSFSADAILCSVGNYCAAISRCCG